MLQKPVQSRAKGPPADIELRREWQPKAGNGGAPVSRPTNLRADGAVQAGRFPVNLTYAFSEVREFETSRHARNPPERTSADDAYKSGAIPEARPILRRRFRTAGPSCGIAAISTPRGFLFVEKVFSKFLVYYCATANPMA
ncbi:hypothetical protein KM043_002118 [Ampulex compressa]|nr:hypothetical protein KM043_002118 [Ampulex compressa]